MQALGESTDCLWWAFGQHSISLGEAYRSVAPHVVALAAPVDLFRYVKAVPASPETETLLAHVLTGMPGIAETVNMLHIKSHYYQSHRTINPTGIVPKGPAIDLSSPPERRGLLSD